MSDKTKILFLITAILILISVTNQSFAAVNTPITGQVTEGDTSIYLIDITKENALTITVSLKYDDSTENIPDDKITLMGVYDPQGKKMTDVGCTGEILQSCKIYNPTPGMWLVEVRGDKIYGSGEINVQASYLINNFQVYYNIYETEDYTTQKYKMDQYSMIFLEKYISTSDRDHLIIKGEWDDYVTKHEISIIAPNLKTTTDTPVEDETNVQTYYLTPGSVAEGKWIILLRALKGQEAINIYTNYGYLDEVSTQQLISDEIKKADEAKEYPILVTDTSTPLILSLIEKQSGDTLLISKVFNPSGIATTCTDFGPGCAIQDPEEGIWLVDISAQSITGTAPFNFVSTHHTYEPKDYEISKELNETDIVYYETYVKTQDKEHMVAVADWTDAKLNVDLTIISANVVTKTAQSTGDEKNVRLYSLSPGNIAEGKWIVQLASLENAGHVNMTSNYNLTRVKNQEIKYIDNIAQDEIQKFLISVNETDIPLVISILEKQSGDDIIILNVINPSGTQTSCTPFKSGCAIQDPKKGVWTVNIKGKSITGTAPYVFASTHPQTQCGNGVCQADIGENCVTCVSDCTCNQFENCDTEQQVCISLKEEVTQNVNENKFITKLKENIFGILIILLIIAGAGYKIYKDKYAF